MSKRLLVVITAVAALLGFGAAVLFYPPASEQRSTTAAVQPDLLIRDHSPILGPSNAPVTIVEFFDPACEACRAFYPVVKQIMESFPGRVRVVLRYATFHEGSDEVARILELARLQGVFEDALEEVLETQPVWATHGAPDLAKAWDAAHAAGLDVGEARRNLQLPEIDAALNQDMADVRAVGVTQTPTFFVNGKPLPTFGAQELYSLVESEVQAFAGSQRK